MDVMGNLLKFGLILLGLLIAGVVLIKLVGFVLHLLWWVAIGAVIVGGVAWLFGKVKRSASGNPVK